MADDAVMWDVLVLGGGIAGLTAAMTAAMDGFRTVVLDRQGPGGRLLNIHQVENYPGMPQGMGGADLAAALTEQAMAAGVEIAFDEATGIEPGSPFRVTTPGATYVAPAVVLATGAELARLHVPGEEEFLGRGVSYCAACDGPFFAGEPVVVVGGGDSAAHEALHLAELASEVHVVFPEQAPHAFQRTQDRLTALPNVRLMPNTRLVEIRGDDGGVTGALLNVAGEPVVRPARGVFIYGGLTPNSALVHGLVPTDATGHVETDAWMQTPVPGLYAAGDVRARSATLLASAAGDGATAGMAAAAYLRELRRRGRAP